MLYVIPFVILLVVLIILKKRESANNEQGADKTKKTNLKKSNKKPTPRATRSTSQPTNPSTTAAVSSSVKTLDPELKSSIESLIQSENYFSAEAKINQALNQDNDQHELYLYLLDIHAAQKDEFAIKQLINYLRSLGLHDIADQADQKHRQSLTQTQESSTTESVKVTSDQSAAPRAVSSNAAFDALMNNDTSTASLDHLQSSPEAHPEEKNDESNPFGAIEYSIEKKPAPSAEQSQALDFNLNTETAVESAPLNDSITLNEPVQDATFSIPDEPAAATDVPPLEFSFTATPEKENSTVELAEDFIFDEQATPSATESEFKPHFDLPKTPEPEPVVLSPIAEFTFHLDQPTAETHTPTFETTVFESTSHTAATVDTHEVIQTADPLAQSFPELLQVNEIQLNLDLAARYIELGAYESARQLLSQNEADYSLEQRDRSQMLLNQIAS